MRSISSLSLVTSLVTSLSLVALAGSADAHVSVASGPAIANKSQIIAFGVGHGCEDAAMKHLDTVKIRVTIPAGVTSVRGLFSDFGKPVLVKSGETVTHVEWNKPDADVLEGDDAYYELKVRAKVPDAPFTKLKFSVEQTCKDPVTNATVIVNWDADEGSTTGSPAPFLTVTPAHGTGWSKIKVTRAVSQNDLPTYFADAQIVWRGTAAYSSNAATATMITSTQGVTALSGGLAVNDELWVRY
jgi:periplasmic copper chaperone A